MCVRIGDAMADRQGAGRGEGKDLNLNHLKNKGRGTDEGKRFVFRTFAKRVASVNIDIHHRLSGDLADARELDADGTEAPLAASTLERWVELNLTGPFKAFRKEVAPLVLSVPLMLRKREELFGTLRRHLANAPGMSLKPMLEVTAAVAADLRQEFYPEFPQLLSTLASLLSPSDVELLEDVFSTLCYLFKYLLRQLLADLPAAFSAYSPLISHDKQHVREFAAESFSYLLRRLPANKLPAAISQALLPHVGTQGVALNAGIAQLLFHTSAGIGNAFHSRTPALLQALLALLHPNLDGRESTFGVVAAALHLMSEHTRRAQADVVWNVLLEELGKGLTVWTRRVGRLSRVSAAPDDVRAAAQSKGSDDAGGEDGSASDASNMDDAEPASNVATVPARALDGRIDAAATHLGWLLRLVRQWVTERHGSRIPEGGRLDLTDKLVPALSATMLTTPAAARGGALRHLLDTLGAVLLAKSTPLDEVKMLARVTSTVQAIFTCHRAGAGTLGTADSSAEAAPAPSLSGLDALQFGVSIAGWQHFGACALEPLLQLCEDATEQHRDSVLSTLFALGSAKHAVRLRLPGEATSEGSACARALCTIVTEATLATTRREGANATGVGCGEQPWGCWRSMWASMSVLSSIEPGSFTRSAPSIVQALSKLLNTPASELDQNGCPQGAALLLHASAIEALVALREDGGKPSRSSRLAKQTAALLKSSFSALLYQDPLDPWSGGWSSPPLLLACSRLLDVASPVIEGSTAAPTLAPDEMLLEAVRTKLWRATSHEAAETRTSALQLLRALHRRGWMLAPSERAAVASTEDVTDRAMELGLAIEDAPLNPTSKQLAFDAEALTMLASLPSLPTGVAQLIIHHALGMLRIKFAHVWHHIRALLQTLVKRWPELLAPPLFARLADAVRASLPSQHRQSSSTEMGVEIPAHADQTSGSAVSAEEDPMGIEDAAIVEGFTLTQDVQTSWEEALQTPPMGTENSHFAAQLLEALAVPPLLDLAVRHSGEMAALWREIVDAVTLNQDDEDDDKAHKSRRGFRGERTARRGLLHGFLSVFAATEEAPGLTNASALYTDCTRLIGHADHRIQTAALECLARWNQPAVNKYKAQLQGLIGDKTFRETLTMFEIDPKQEQTMARQHRPVVLPLLTTILYSKLTQRAGRGASKNAMAQRRATIFAFFCAFEPTELRDLVGHLLAPLAAVGATTSAQASVSAPVAAEEARARGAAVASLTSGQQLGVLRSLHEAVAQLGGALSPYLPQLLAALQHLMLYATHCVCSAGNHDDAEAENVPSAEGVLLPNQYRLEPQVATTLTLVQAREARLWATKLFGLFVQAFPTDDLTLATRVVLGCLTPVLQRLHTHYTQSPAGVLNAVHLLVQQPSTLSLLELSATPVLPCAYATLSAPRCAQPVLDTVIGIIEALLQHSSAKGSAAGVGEATIAKGGMDDDEDDSEDEQTEKEKAQDDEESQPSAFAAAAAARAMKEAASAAVVAAAAATAERLLREHMHDLLSQLNARLRSKFGGNTAKALAAAGGGAQATRELRLFTRLSRFVENAEQAAQLIELFLPYLRLKSTPRTERVKEDVLRLVGGLVTVASEPQQHVRMLSQLFGTVRARGSRTALCSTFAALAEHLAARGAASPEAAKLVVVAHALTELNAFSVEELEEPDYDRRLVAYNRLPALIQDESGVQLALPLLCHCIHDVELDDIALKHSASHTITLIVQHAAKQPDEAGYAPMLQRVLMPALRRGMRLPAEKDVLRSDMIRLLGATLLIFPTLQPEMAKLLSPQEPEADFYNNLTHVQMPRRQRALARLRQRIAAGAFGTPTLSNYLLPMLRHLVLRDSAKEVDVADEAVHTLRELASRLPWRPYLSTLQAFTRMLKKQPYLEKRLVRAMVATLDVFHFDLAVPEEPAGGKAVVAEVEAQPAADDVPGGEKADDDDEENDEPDDEDGAAAEDEEAAQQESADAAAAAETPEAKAARAASVMRSVRSSLLPELYSHLKDPKTEGVRVAVALAVLKLLLLMPQRVLKAELHGFLMRVVQTVSSRNKVLRQQGREALAKVVLELGAPNFGAVLHELKTSLTKGYQIHVLGYTVHYLLSKLVPTLQPGDLDYCARPLVKVLLADLFGEAAEKKEVEEIATSMKEARATRSFASFELLASAIQFVPNINLLVPPLHEAVLAAPGGVDSLKNIGIVRDVLRHAALGLGANRSVEIQPLCVYVRGMLITHLPPKPTGAAAGGGGNERAAPVGSVRQPITEAGVTSGSGRNPLAHELLAFAIGLLMSALRRSRFTSSNDTCATPSHIMRYAHAYATRTRAFHAMRVASSSHALASSRLASEPYHAPSPTGPDLIRLPLC